LLSCCFAKALAEAGLNVCFSIVPERWSYHKRDVDAAVKDKKAIRLQQRQRLNLPTQLLQQLCLHLGADGRIEKTFVPVDSLRATIAKTSCEAQVKQQPYLTNL